MPTAAILIPFSRLSMSFFGSGRARWSLTGSLLGTERGEDRPTYTQTGLARNDFSIHHMFSEGFLVQTSILSKAWWHEWLWLGLVDPIGPRWHPNATPQKEY